MGINYISYIKGLGGCIISLDENEYAVKAILLAVDRKVDKVV